MSSEGGPVVRIKGGVRVPLNLVLGDCVAAVADGVLPENLQTLAAVNHEGNSDRLGRLLHRRSKLHRQGRLRNAVSEAVVGRDLNVVLLPGC